MEESKFKYDVAFSFMAGDEGLATQLNDLLQERLSTFLYSERQAEISGTDGETSFNDVFAEQARCVVILYREGWGQTSWTRIEETAIRNRAHAEGYDFALFIPLDAQPSVPRWLPKNRLWIGLDRWGAKGAAAVIEARAQDLGAAPHIETLEDRAARHARHTTFEGDKAEALSGNNGPPALGKGFRAIVEALRLGVERLNAAQSTTKFLFSRWSDTEPMANAIIQGLPNGFTLNQNLRYSNSMENAWLEAVIWDGPPVLPNMMYFERPSTKRTKKYLLGYSQARTYIWLTDGGKSGELSNDAAAEHMLRWYLDNGG
jgi:hypothetical protein